jgi:NADH-quinone oxidoreductase subunit G
VDPGLNAELSRPELTSRISDLDYAGAILVIGADPMHEMPILDLRIRKAARRGGAKLLVASERPNTLDGGAATDAVRYAPGEAGTFLRALAAALAPRDAPAEGPHAKDAAALAEQLRAVPDPIIVWGERLWRSPGAVEALHEIARALDMHQKIGPGLLCVPEESNTRGLREAGVQPKTGPGLLPAKEGNDAASVRDGSPRAVLLLNSDPVRTYPEGDRWAKTLAGTFVVSFAMFDDESTRHANVVFPTESHAEKEGVVTHPDGRLQRLRPNVPLPHGIRPGWWALCEIAAKLGLDLPFGTPEDVFKALSSDVPFYGETAYEEIGGMGLRPQERDPGASWTPERAGSPSPVAAPAPAPSENGGLTLGTYRDIWAGEVTERNPALRFLAPSQRLEISAADAKELELEHGEPVTVSSNGHSVEAFASLKARAKPGVAFLIEGVGGANANVFGAGATITVAKRAVPETNGSGNGAGSLARVVETPMPAEGAK